MTQVKIFSSIKFYELETKVNEFLKELDDVKVDIKYATSESFCDCMVIFEKNKQNTTCESCKYWSGYVNVNQPSMQYCKNELNIQLDDYNCSSSMQVTSDFYCSRFEPKGKE